MRCKICLNDINNQIHLVSEMMYGTGQNYSYLECSKCGCLQIIDHPNEISEFYPSDYYSFSPYNTFEDNLAKRLIKNIRSRFFKIRGKFYLNSKPLVRFFTGKFFDFFLPKRQPLASLRLPYFYKLLEEIKANFEDKILDVGCGAGYGLILMHQYGYNSLTGIDPFIEQDIIYNQNVKILKKGFEEINNIYDIVLFQHSFEHMPEPSKVFEHLNLVTNNNSNIIISIPVADSYAWAKYKTDWVQIDAPRHYFIHTKKSIELLASANGFYITKIKYDSSELQFWGSEQYKNGIPLRHEKSYAYNIQNSIFTKSQIKGFIKQAHELNLRGLGDQAIFYLKKIS